MAGLSVCHFARMFKQTVGISPHRYVLQCRVEFARELIAGTDMPLSEIAIVTGFSDQSHYTPLVSGNCRGHSGQLQVVNAMIERDKKARQFNEKRKL